MTRSKVQWIGLGMALLGAVLAVVLLLPITLWSLVNDGGTTAGQYVYFASMCAVLAGVGSVPGLIVGRALAKEAAAIHGVERP